MHGRIVIHLVFGFVDQLDFAKYFACVSDDNISASNRAKRFFDILSNFAFAKETMTRPAPSQQGLIR